MDGGEGHVTPTMVATGQDQHSRVDLVIAFDASGSMALPFHDEWPEEGDPSLTNGPSKREWLSERVPQVVSRLDAEDRLGIVGYNTSGRVVRPLREVREYDVDALRLAVARYDVSGGANLCSGLEMATRLLSEGPDPNRQKHLLFVSDSLPSASPDRSPFVNQLREVAGGDVTLTFVGLDSAPSRELNRSLVAIDGVTQYYFDSAETPPWDSNQ